MAAHSRSFASREMKSKFMAALFLTVAIRADGQTTHDIEPFKPDSVGQSKQATPNLNLDKWKEGSGPTRQPPGVTIYFDYTKFFEWLLPKKHPKIPPECDPMYFDRDTLPTPPVIKPDTVRDAKPPV